MNELLKSIFSASNFAVTPLLGSLFLSLLINLITVWVVVHFFYYPKGRRRDYYFTFIMLSVSIFMLIALLLQDSADMGIGAALGLFAIFGIIRYRTESVPIREMTYLFFLVALSVLNGKSDNLTLLEQIIVNAAFVVCVWICENFLTHSNEGCKFVKYDNIELIKPERYDELKADLEERLGLKIIRVEVGAVDFLTDMTMLRVFYLDSEKRIKSVDRQLKITPDQAFINP
ncbi:MAG: DUF4956 domain-containing protein [Bacteroidales bacterium]|nr:DUF4956 domain-containing protein [Bacteroidales bacterium]MDD6583383.1 DUF4956 domain-containing protein [Bacteroidales bacterium]